MSQTGSTVTVLSPLELLVRDLCEQFYAAVERKTGWGKEELKLEFERCLSNALARTVSAIVEEP